MKIRVSRRAAVLVLGAAVMGTAEAVIKGNGLDDLRASCGQWLIVALAAFIHEAGHAVAAWGCGVRIRGLRLDLLGARMELGGMLSYGQEFLVAAGGPLANLLSAALVLPLWLEAGGEAAGGRFLFLAASLGLGGLNLLPVGTMDGGRMLRCLLARLFGERVANGALGLTTGLCLGCLWLLSVYALLRVSRMLSLFAFTLCLIFRLAAPAETVGGEGSDRRL